MRIDLYAVRRIRILKVSKPGEWVSAETMSDAYNNMYALGLVTELMKKSLMHPLRMKRILQRMITEGYYEHDPAKGFRFLTKTPNAPKRR